jgi:hypothetical protein
MGRTPKYKNKEEALAAQKQQIRVAEERYKQLRKIYRESVTSKQMRIITLLNKNVIEDTPFLESTLAHIQKLLKPTETATKETTSTETQTD